MTTNPHGDDLVDEQESRSRLNPVIWVAVATIVVVAIVAGAVALLKPKDEQATKPASTGDDVNYVQRGTVVAGEGGSRKAPDGRTVTGFPQSCDGAAGALASYLPVLQNDVPGKDLGTSKAKAGKARPHLKETLDYILLGSPTKSDLSAHAWPTASIASRTDVVGGGYKVQSCSAQKATVSILSCGTIVGLPAGEHASNCGTQTYVLTFLDDDWRIYSDETGNVTGPEPRAGVSGPLSTKTRRQILSRQDDWKEFANAPA